MSDKQKTRIIQFYDTHPINLLDRNGCEVVIQDNLSGEWKPILFDRLEM